MDSSTPKPIKRKYTRRESWGSIRQLPSGRFLASWSFEGKRYSAPHTFLTRTDARAFIAQVHADIVRGVWKPESEREIVHFGEYATNWVARRKNAQGAKLRPKTRAEYERQLRTTLSEFADLKLTSLTRDRIQNWYDRRSDMAPSAAAAEARLLRAILGKAVEEEKLTRNPVPSDLTKSARKTAHVVPTPEQLDALYAAIPDRFKLGIRLAAWAGLRLSEWRALERRDFMLVGKQFHVRVERQAQYVKGSGWVVDDPKSEHGKRTQVLPSWMTPEVKAHLDRMTSAGSDLLFPTKTNTYFHNKAFYKSWNAARDLAGVRSSVRAHDLRGFAGSHLMGTARANIIEARDFLGHAESATTEKFYIKKVSDRASQLAEAMPVPFEVQTRLNAELSAAALA